MRLGARRLNLRQLMDPQTYILWDAVMELFNESDEGIRFPDERELTTQAIIAEGGAPSRKSFFRTRQKLSAFLVDGQPLVEMTGGENHGSDTSYTFKVNWELLSPTEKTIQFPTETAETEPSRERDGLAKERKEPKERKEDLDLEQKEPIPDLVVITGNSKEVATVENSGSGSSFEIQQLEELEVVRSMLSYGVNKTIIANAFMCKGQEWVESIFYEFNSDVQKAHNMRSPAGVLATRLKDYDETWRKLPVEPTYDVAPGLIEKWQTLMDEQVEKENGQCAPRLVRDFAREAGIPFGKAIERSLINTYGFDPYDL